MYMLSTNLLGKRLKYDFFGGTQTQIKFEVSAVWVTKLNELMVAGINELGSVTVKPFSDCYEAMEGVCKTSDCTHE